MQSGSGERQAGCGKRPAPYSLAAAKATDPARCASYHPKIGSVSSGVELVVQHMECVQGQLRRTTHMPALRRPMFFSSHPLLPFLVYFRLMGRRSLAGDGPGCAKRTRRRTTMPRRKKRRTRRDVLHTTQKEGSVRRTMLECSSGVELVLRSWHCVVINAHLASGICLSSANPRLGHLHPSLGAAPAATRHGDCFYFSIASRQVISPALSPAIHSNNEWTCNKKVLKGFERDFCRLAQVSGSVKPR